MKVNINNEEHQITDNSTLQMMVNELGWGERDGIAIAIENNVVPKQKWEDFELENNQKITIIQAFQGG